jgi:methylated-DNA-[protein]-cysteine S-methyltransferase
MRPSSAALATTAASTPTLWCEFDAPIGPLLLAGSCGALTLVYFQSGPRPWRPPGEWLQQEQTFRPAITQLREYFAGTRRHFALALAPRGTPFQLAVWQLLRAIPYGQTMSYGEIARGLGRPEAARAVGLANGANPLPIIVPCHRVIGADGSLTGFGGGVPIKRALLQLEGAACVSDLFSDQQRT